jgi:uncharacterized membrane protein (Fun14 family)
VTSLAIDIGFGALLVLAMEEPLQAAMAMGVLLVVALFQLPLVFRAHMGMIRAGRSWLRALVFPGKWVQEDQLPESVIMAASTDGPIPGKPLRGAPATLLDKRVRLGWLVLTSDGPLFVQESGKATPLQGIPGTAGEWAPLHVRKPVGTGGGEGEPPVFKDGPRVADLELVIPSGASY